MYEELQSKVDAFKKMADSNASLEDLLNACPDFLNLDDEEYLCLCIMPSHGGLTFVGYREMETGEENPTLTVETPHGVKDALKRMANLLAGYCNPRWSDEM